LKGGGGVAPLGAIPLHTASPRQGPVWPRESPLPCIPENGLELGSLVDVYT
jgi:hypothetical protein